MRETNHNLRRDAPTITLSTDATGQGDYVMSRRFWTRSAFAISLFSLSVSQLLAQPQIIEISQAPEPPAPRFSTPAPAEPAARATTAEVPPSIPVTTVAPTAPTSATSSVPPVLPTAESLTLDQCIDIGMQHQPALAAARASLAAAQAGKRGVDRMILPGLFAKDLPIRRQQACHGVTIAEAGLQQADAETRYSITRNFFSVQYVRAQIEVIDDVQAGLKKAYKRAHAIFIIGDPKNKMTKLDLDAIEIQMDLVNAKKAKTDNGLLKAYAALREAMGVRHDYPLDKQLVKQDLPAPVYTFDLNALIASALANRAEMAQANAASSVTALEIQAQYRIVGWQGKAFPISGDIHAKQIPQSVFNNEYRPGGIGMEYPPMLIGSKHNRVARAVALNDRAQAVTDKTYNLISLDVEAMYLKWQEAVTEIQYYSAASKKAGPLLDDIIKKSGDNPGDLTSGPIIQASTIAVMARTQLNEARHTHALALAGLERATAGTFNVFPAPAAAAAPPPDKK